MRSKFYSKTNTNFFTQQFKLRIQQLLNSRKFSKNLAEGDCLFQISKSKGVFFPFFKTALTLVPVILLAISFHNVQAQDAPKCSHGMQIGDFETSSSISDELKNSYQSRIGTGVGAIVMSYDGNVPNEARTAGNYAASIITNTLALDIDVKVQVSWSQLSTSTYANASPNGFRSASVIPNPAANYVAYPVALANQLEGTDSNGETAEIVVSINSSINWYFGTDSNTPADRFDLVEVLLHELCHGLGFFGSVQFNNGNYSVGNGNGEILIYDYFVERRSDGTPIYDLRGDQTALGGVLTSFGLEVNGTDVEAIGVDRRFLHLPNPYNNGSSYSHWREGRFETNTENALMTPSLVAGESVHDLGPLTKALFKQMGYRLAGETSNGAPVVVNPIPDTYLISGFGEKRIPLADVFSDPDGDPLTYSLSVQSQGYGGTIALEGNEIVIPDEGATGFANVTVTADDGNGNSVSDQFQFGVDPPTPEPVVVNPIPDQMLDPGFGSISFNLLDVFNEPVDGTEQLSFSFSSSDETVVDLSVLNDTLFVNESGQGETMVTVSAFNAVLGGSTAVDTFMITVGNADAIAIDSVSSFKFLIFDYISSESKSLLPGDSLTYRVALSNGEGTDYSWSFPGGTPSTSSESSPTIQYDTVGVFDIQLVVSDSISGTSDTLILTSHVNVIDASRAEILIEESTTSIFVSAGSPGTVEDIGDFNNDGIGDVAVRNYILLGRNSFPDSIDIANGTAENVIVISSGLDYTSAGDVNGDGIPDIVGRDVNGQTNIIFGATSLPDSISTGSLDGTNGFIIALDDDPNFDVKQATGAGDVNGDGFDDILISDWQSNANGIAFVIYGSATPVSRFQLRDIDGTTGFFVNGIAIDPDANFTDFGYYLNSAGDLNNDGIDDLMIAARPGGFNGLTGGAYVSVIFGNGNGFPAEVQINSLDGSNGFLIKNSDGISVFDIADVGDINDDGINDILIKDGLGFGYDGNHYLVFGQQGTFSAELDLANLTNQTGIKIFGLPNNDVSQPSVSGKIDFNGDGVNDIVIGIGGIHGGESNNGTYIVYGRQNMSAIDLSIMGSEDGVIIKTEDRSDFTGAISGTIGDINGDGNTDLFLSNFFANEFYIYLANPADVNNAPLLVNPIPDQSFEEGFATESIFVGNVFTDEDQDTLSFTAFSSNEDIVSVSIEGDSLIVTEVGIGESTITLEANDGKNGVSTTDFNFEITEKPNSAPKAVNTIEDQVLEEGFELLTLNVGKLFEDEDGDDLSINVFIEDPNVVDVTVGGDFLIIEEIGLGSTEVTIQADDGNGGEANIVFNVEVAVTLGVLMDEVIDFQVYPNPANEILTLGRSNLEIKSVKIITMDGQKIELNLNESNDMDVSQLPDGIYLLRIDLGQQIITRRVSIMH